jgi:hypothetical protein
MPKPILNHQFFLRLLLGLYLVPLLLVCNSLSVPPHDLLFCGLMFVFAILGLVFTPQAGRAWRVFWTVALAVSLLCGGLEVIAGKNIARQRSTMELKAED